MQRHSMISRLASKRNSNINDDDKSESSDDRDYNQLGETLVRATKFLGIIVKGQNNNDDRDPNLDIDSYRRSVGSIDPMNMEEESLVSLNERYEEVNNDNLYNCLRSARRSTNDRRGGNHSVNDEFSLDSDDASEMALPLPPLDGGDSSNISKGEDSFLRRTPSAVMLRRPSDVAIASLPRGTSASSSHSAEILATKSTIGSRSSTRLLFNQGNSNGPMNSSYRDLVNTSDRDLNAFNRDLRNNWDLLRSTEEDGAWSGVAGDSCDKDSSINSTFTDHHAKSRATFVRRNMSRAASRSKTFHDVQKLMKDKGAITGSSIRHILQEAAEEHAVNNELDRIGELDSSFGSGDLSIGLDEKEPQQLHTLRINGVDIRNDCSDDNHLRKAVSQIEEESSQQHEGKQQRLEQDPMFGKLSDMTMRPFIKIPSRENIVETLIDLIRNAADHGECRLLVVHGTKFVGKTRLIKNVIDTVQSQGLGYTVLTSLRSANDNLTSFFCFREITSAALRACDSVTESFDVNNDVEQVKGSQRGLNKEEEDNEFKLILERLKRRKILNKSDQLMISRILPVVMDDQLLSLLKGRSPAALTKEIATALFKILIPLQPLCFVFEADGDDCDIDPSSWDLIEEMLLSARTQCPQMLMIAVSRHSLLDNISHDKNLNNQFVNVDIKKMDKSDTVCYIRALFCDANIDRNMQVDPHVADAVYHRANGCPLFTERIVLWSQMKNLFELDETRNAVSLNLPTIDRNGHEKCSDSSIHDEAWLLQTLPANLNEEILEKINNLPHNLLDALKVAAQIGITFDVDNYASMCLQGFHNSLQELITSHGIFDEKNGHCYRWRHVAVYEAVLSIIISNERLEIQGRIADSLRDLPLSHIGNNCVQYARHCALAERWDDAFDRYMEAGDKAEKKHDFAGAVGIYQQAKMCLTKTRKNMSLQRRLSPHAALGLCLRELMRYEDAETELEFCLEQIMTVPECRRNVDIELEVVTTLATLKQSQSKYSEAMAMFERALPLARANKVKHSQVWLAHHVASCAEIHRKAGDLLQAKTLHTEAMAYRELAVKENSCTILELAISFTQLGCTLSGLGDYSCAYNLHRKALAARVDNLDFYHSLVSESLNYCADALQALGRGCEGVPLSMHAVKIRKFVFGPNHPAYAHSLSVLASCYHQVGRSFDALGLLEECLDICEKTFSPNHTNMIPNLMLYGSVLSVLDKCEMARVAFTRALNIHKMNFKEGQNTHQLVKLQNALEELSARSEPQTKRTAMLDMPISFESSTLTHVVVCADFGHRSSDEYMLCCAASFQKMGILKLVSIVAVSPPQVVCANIAREALDSLLLSNVPVAYGTSSTSESRTSNDATLSADYGKLSAHVSNTGFELLRRVLLKAPEKSLVIMCTAYFDDVSELINSHRDLFASKVKEVVIIGSVKPLRRRCFIEPEDFGGDKEDSFAKNVYSACQESDIPTVTLFKSVAQGFPFSSTLVDDLTLSNHMISTKVQQAEEMYVNGVWELIRQLKSETSYFAPKNVDVKRFHKYSLGGKPPTAGQRNIWPSIKSINLELVLGLLCCIPTYQKAHFRWESHQVRGTVHKVCRHVDSIAGIINAIALSNELHMLIGFAIRASLLNTSC